MIGGYSPWFCEEFARRIEEECAASAMHLGKGMAATYEDYRQFVGFIQGLEKAKVIADEIKQEQDAA